MEETKLEANFAAWSWQLASLATHFNGQMDVSKAGGTYFSNPRPGYRELHVGEDIFVRR